MAVPFTPRCSKRCPATIFIVLLAVPTQCALVALHQAMGFALAGTYPEIGRKFGKFWDVALYLRAMG